MRHSYWTCSNFADSVRGTKKPYALELHKWDEWHENAKASHPIRYYIAEEFLGTLQDIVYYIPDRINDARCYFKNRFIVRGHALTASPDDVKPGDWCDLTARLLYCSFNELVNFVEIECAWMNVVFSKEKKTELPFWHRINVFRWAEWRSKEAGLSYLTWASKLLHDESWGYKPDSEEYGTLTDQARSAIEIMELYNWWTVIRKQRPDPYRDKTDNPFLLEKTYDDEDTEMLVRLVKVRQSLWT